MHMAVLDELCGDGLVQPGEECDDGNRESHDGCTACTVDDPQHLTCRGAPSVCTHGTSCAGIHARFPGLASGAFYILEPGRAARRLAWCDMATDGGGWLHLATFRDGDPMLLTAAAVGPFAADPSDHAQSAKVHDDTARALTRTGCAYTPEGCADALGR
jgi:cysteine-rich repeat protein